MKLTNVSTLNEETGETGSISRADYIKGMVKLHEVQPYESEDGAATPEKVVEHLLKSFEEGKEADEGISSQYGELKLLIEADYNRTADSKKSAADEAAAAKEKKEKEKAEREAKEKAQKEALALTQKEFAISAGEGAQLASSELVQDLENLKASLPAGVTVVQKGTGYGINFADDATKETIAKTLGYLEQRSANNSVLNNQLQFWIGDTISEAVKRGIYQSGKEAAIHIASVIKETTGKEYVPASFDQYVRMANRTPIEYRNAEADQTTFLEIAKMKTPRKGDKEKDEDFQKRTKAFEKDREELQKRVASGEIVKRKDILKPVEEVLIKHGLKTPPSEEPKVSITQQSLLFFHSTLAIESLVGAVEPDVAIYLEGDKKITVSKADLEEIQASSKAHLLNAFYTNTKANISPKDYINGYVEKSVPTKVGTSADGKDIMENTNTKFPVFPPPFFQVPAEEEKAPDAAPAEEAAK